VTARPISLENFDDFAPEPETSVQEVTQQDRLAAYDEGYGAGWDDGAAATRAEIEGAEAELAAHLQDLTFTFHEARAHVMRTVQPLLMQALSHALPRILHETLAHRLAEEIDALIDAGAAPEITLLVPPGAAETLAPSLRDVAGLPIVPREDADLPPGELHLRLGAESELRLDLGALDRVLDDAFAALDTINKETLAHG